MTTGLPTALTLDAESDTAVTVKVTLYPAGGSATATDLTFSCSVTASTSNSRMRLLNTLNITNCDTNEDCGENAKCNVEKEGEQVVSSSCTCNDGYEPNNDKTECVQKSSEPTPPPSGCSIAVNAPTTLKYGNYTVKASSDTNTIKDSGATGAYFRYDADVAIGTKQETPQTVDSTSSDKKSFTVAFDTAVTTALPRFYAEEKSEKEIPCTLSSDNKTATCTPTNDHMKDGKKYTIHYRTGCAKTGKTTGIEVEYESSAYTKVGSVLLIALGVFLL